MKNMKKLPLTAIALVLLCASMLTACAKEESIPTPPPEITPEAVVAVSDAPAETGEKNAPQIGDLLDKGSGLNANYYPGLYCFGGPSDLTDESFMLGKVSMCMDANGQPMLEPFAVYYDENTVVKTSVIRGDTYEIYASAVSEMEKYFDDKNYSFDIFHVDEADGKLYAREIRISRMLFN